MTGKEKPPRRWVGKAEHWPSGSDARPNRAQGGSRPARPRVGSGHW